MSIKLGIRDIEKNENNKELFEKYEQIKQADKLCIFYASTKKDEEKRVICDKLYDNVMLSNIEVKDYFRNLKKEHNKSKSFIKKINSILQKKEVNQDGKTEQKD